MVVTIFNIKILFFICLLMYSTQNDRLGPESSYLPFLHNMQIVLMISVNASSREGIPVNVKHRQPRWNAGALRVAF